MWETSYHCVNCDNELSNYERMYNKGRCPLCGYKDRDAGTIVNTNERTYRIIGIAPWWKFWVRRFERKYKQNI